MHALKHQIQQLWYPQKIAATQKLSATTLVADNFCDSSQVMENEVGIDLDTTMMGITTPLWNTELYNDDGSSSEETPEDVEDESEEELPEGIWDGVDGNNSMNKEPFPIKVGDMFASAKECRDVIINASILANNVVNFEKSDNKRIVAKCSSEGCKWRIYARAEQDSDSVVIKTLLDDHTCLRLNVSTNKLAASIWVSDRIINMIREHPEFQPKPIQTFIKSQYQIDIKYMTAWRAKEKALEKIYGLWKELYKILPDYIDCVLQSNPGSIAAFTGEDCEQIFEQLKLRNETAANWIEKNHPENWAASKLQGDTYGHITSNMAEIFNKWIRPTR
ncbi:hypothetical protein BVC80_1671g4 [Macleaya cordata]|uniref:Transposase MuDR plant domain-containing protein n=1 Tax=Macleaya cordata TaxID=56857 RepID=A0A200PPQ1_MACCD|nr:hypothetical protein BVC80_1671g4 [Macleaya cordata]